MTLESESHRARAFLKAQLGLHFPVQRSEAQGGNIKEQETPGQ